MTPPYPVTIPDTTKPASNAGHLATSVSTAPCTNAPLVSSGLLATSKPVALSDDVPPPGKHLLSRPRAEDPLVALHAPLAWSLPNLASLLESHRLAAAVPRP